MESFFSKLHTRQTAQDTDAASTSTSQTDGLVGQLIWKNSLQQRTTTIVTISFNILSALLIIASISFDASKASKRGLAPRARNKFQFISNIHAADTFPLVISNAIVVQGALFLALQGTGLSNLHVNHCRAVSQIVWPAFWIVAYTLVVFGIEVAFRGFQRKRFHPRARFTIPICWSIVLTMLIATWVPSQVYKNPKNYCTASLLSWAMPWADIALFLNSTLLFVYLLTGFLIAFQLSRTAKIDRNERIAASRTVYYLAIGVILMSGVLPFWAYAVRQKPMDSAARIATVALNIFGLLTGVLYLILRSNSKNMAFRPAAASWEKKQEWRLFGSPDLDIAKHIANPVRAGRHGTHHAVVLPLEKSQFESRTIASRAPTDPAEAKEARLMADSPPFYRTPPKSTITKPPLSSPPSYRAPHIPSANDPLLISPPKFQIPTQMSRSDSQSQSFNQAQYTIFPQRSESTPAAATNLVDSPKIGPGTPPARLFFNHHKRDISDSSSATVHIGMRQSTTPVKSEVPEHPHRAVTYPPIIDCPNSEHSRDPRQLTQRSLDRIVKPLASPFTAKHRSRDSTPHEILFRINSNEELSPEFVPSTTPLWPKPLEDLVSPTRRITSWRTFRDTRMKTLPPVPATPSKMQSASSFRAMFAGPRSPVPQNGYVRTSQERSALSLALKEDEQWPLQGVNRVLLPDKSYTPDEKRSWI